MGLDLGFGHGGEPQIVVGWVIAICDLRFAIRLRDLGLIFCDLCLWRWLVVDYVCWGLVCSG